MRKSMTRKLSPWPALAVCCVAGLLPARAYAEASAAQKAAAESLFDDGLRAMKSGHFVEACPKLEESQRIDPGIGTLLYLGECYEKTGRNASAWATFREAASTAQAQGETDRSRIAAQRADRLQSGLSKLTIRVAPETAQLSSLRVTRDATPLASALFGVAIPVDPGKYRVTASADGYQSYETELEVNPGGDNKSLEIPALKALPTPAPSTLNTTTSPAQAAPPATSSASAQPNSNDSGTNGNGLRNAAYVSGALGVVGLGIGSYFGVKAISKNSDAERYCPDGNRCNAPQGESYTNDAKHAAVISNIAFGVGAAFVAAGVVLYLVREPAHQSAQLELHPLVGRELAGLGLGGNFR